MKSANRFIDLLEREEMARLPSTFGGPPFGSLSSTVLLYVMG